MEHDAAEEQTGGDIEREAPKRECKSLPSFRSMYVVPSVTNDELEFLFLFTNIENESLGTILNLCRLRSSLQNVRKENFSSSPRVASSTAHKPNVCNSFKLKTGMWNSVAYQ
jgi:hypothetical protein